MVHSEKFPNFGSCNSSSNAHYVQRQKFAFRLMIIRIYLEQAPANMKFIIHWKIFNQVSIEMDVVMINCRRKQFWLAITEDEMRHWRAVQLI